MSGIEPENEMRAQCTIISGILFHGATLACCADAEKTCLCDAMRHDAMQMRCGRDWECEEGGRGADEG